MGNVVDRGSFAGGLKTNAATTASTLASGTGSILERAITSTGLNIGSGIVIKFGIGAISQDIKKRLKEHAGSESNNEYTHV